MADLMQIILIPLVIILYCLFVVELADNHDIESAQRWVCVFGEDRPYCETFRQERIDETLQSSSRKAR